MSEPTESPVEQGTANPGGSGPGNGAGKGSPPLTLTNQRGITVPAMPGANGGTLMVGNPGNKGSDGRPPKLTREALATAAGEAHEPYIKLRNDWLKKAQQYLDSGEDDKADRAQKAADRIQEGYMRYGIGSKQEVTWGSPEMLEVFDRAMTEEGVDNEVAMKVLDRVKAYERG